jgi:hypothetical protein
MRTHCPQFATLATALMRLFIDAAEIPDADLELLCEQARVHQAG